ncbi:hypothetical protein ACHAAC_04685 [Aeromicrobium sp. CF4.19]|uniref:hypothetical protein n=1 Tax=Aeromicrobium sp. CF4.19 TaxID=3373082 RepID=UPI003EE7903E
MAERDEEFDDIVRRLDLDWDDPGLVRRPEPEPDRVPELDPADESDPPDEQFYRRLPDRPARPWHRGRVLAWGGVLGTPAVLVLCTMAGVWLSGPVLLTAGLTFVAGSIYLISQLPEHGPSRPDWPDDGAAL